MNRVTLKCTIAHRWLVGDEAEGRMATEVLVSFMRELQAAENRGILTFTAISTDDPRSRCQVLWIAVDERLEDGEGEPHWLGLLRRFHLEQCLTTSVEDLQIQSRDRSSLSPVEV